MPAAGGPDFFSFRGGRDVRGSLVTTRTWWDLRMAPSEQPELILPGIAASPGVAHGSAFVYLQKQLEIPSYHVAKERLPQEVRRFEAALLETRRQVGELRQEVAERLGEDEAAIFDAHLMVLEDKALIDETIREMEQTELNIDKAFEAVADRYIEAFLLIPDSYLRERVADLRDVSRRLLHNLLGKPDVTVGRLTEGHVIVTDDLSPSETATLEKGKALAIVTDVGSRTSHAVIMARSLGVPAVVGLHDGTRKVASDDIVLVDGYDGVVIVNPSEETLFKYGKIRLERQTIQRIYDAGVKQPARTRCGQRVELHVNVEGIEVPERLVEGGAEGVGLFRTEGIFLRGTEFPGEEEQFLAYRKMVEGFGGRPVTIRTLDLGGDKGVPGGLFENDEANPFLGYRAIRFCLEQPRIFKKQLRAILRASAFGKVKLLYPMISGVPELLAANRLLEESKAELRERGEAFDERIEVGSMIEIPSAAIVADLLAEHCDFFSIGTNDLIQYLLAVDRVNDRVAHLYEPAHPAVLRTLRMVIEAARKRRIPVGVCGEMAGEPLFAPLLLGLGAAEISVSLPMLAEIKYLIRRLRLADAVKLAGEVLELDEPKEVYEKLRAFHSQTMGDLSRVPA